MSDSNSPNDSNNSMAEVFALLLTRLKDNAAKTESADAALAAFNQVLADVQMKEQSGTDAPSVCPVCGKECEAENAQRARAPKTRRRPVPMLDESLNDVRQVFEKAREELRQAQADAKAEAKVVAASSTLVALRELVSTLVPIEFEARTAYVKALVRLLQRRYPDATSIMRIIIVANPKTKDLKLSHAEIGRSSDRNTYVLPAGKNGKKTEVSFVLQLDETSDETLKFIGAQFGLLLF